MADAIVESRDVKRTRSLFLWRVFFFIYLDDKEKVWSKTNARETARCDVAVIFDLIETRARKSPARALKQD